MTAGDIEFHQTSIMFRTSVISTINFTLLPITNRIISST
jgi:hypothetical protein